MNGQGHDVTISVHVMRVMPTSTCCGNRGTTFTAKDVPDKHVAVARSGTLLAPGSADNYPNRLFVLYGVSADVLRKYREVRPSRRSLPRAGMHESRERCALSTSCLFPEAERLRLRERSYSLECEDCEAWQETGPWLRKRDEYGSHFSAGAANVIDSLPGSESNPISFPATFFPSRAFIYFFITSAFLYHSPDSLRPF